MAQFTSPEKNENILESVRSEKKNSIEMNKQVKELMGTEFALGLGMSS